MRHRDPKQANDVDNGVMNCSGTRWVEGPCAECGQPTRMLGGLLKRPDGTDALAAGDLPVICDECDNRSIRHIDREMRAQHGADYLEHSRVPEGLADVPLHPKLEQFLTDDKPGLWLCGETGSYKTSMSAVFIERWCHQVVRPARYANEHRFAEELKNWDERRGVLKRFSGISLLVLDDIGKFSQKEFGAADFFAVLDERYATRETKAGGLKKTLFVSEHSYDVLCSQLERFNDAALRRRLSDLCGPVVRVHKPGGQR